jgi:hypothetical protein
MRIRRHHHHDGDQHDERDEQPVWQASKPAWGVVSIDAPKAVELRSPDRAA